MKNGIGTACKRADGAMRYLESNTQTRKNFFLADIIFILLIFFYAVSAWQGILLISGNGAELDSDLQTYAQGMAGEAYPHLFIDDPVLNARNEANSIPNLQRMLAKLLLKNDDFAVALLGAGAIAIFIFYSGWYLFGRLIFRSPLLAAMLALLMGITVWVGWGTFWGINHSDPVPRVFFAAIFPFLLLLGTYSIEYTVLRPVSMLACGLAMWVHGVNALNCGAMFFSAFFFLKKPKTSSPRHIGNLLLCLLAFFAPVLYFLWPSLSQTRSFSQEELALFNEFFALRWEKDYSDFGARLLNFFSISNPPFCIFLCGIGSWLLIYKKSSGLLRSLCKMFPCFIFAILLVVCFCWGEGRWALENGRLPMGHELIRGIRFCVPLSWIMVTALCALFMPKLLWRYTLLLLLAGILIFSADRQFVAAQYLISKYTGISLPLKAVADEEHKKAENKKALLELVKSKVPQGEAVFSDEDLMQIRYLALHPLAHAFKDGYVFFYNKDYPRSAEWLKLEKILRSGGDSYLEAWRLSKTPWFVSRKADSHFLAPYADIEAEKGEWKLYKLKGQYR